MNSGVWIRTPDPPNRLFTPDAVAGLGAAGSLGLGAGLDLPMADCTAPLICGCRAPITEEMMFASELNPLREDDCKFAEESLEAPPVENDEDAVLVLDPTADWTALLI